jgi:hypothetical protein
LKIEDGEMEREEESKDSLEEERERSGEEMMVKQAKLFPSSSTSSTSTSTASSCRSGGLDSFIGPLLTLEGTTGGVFLSTLKVTFLLSVNDASASGGWGAIGPVL